MRDRLLGAYRSHYNPSLARMFDAYGAPVELAGSGAVLQDEEGCEYLDFSGGHGVFGVGHGNGAVRAAVLDQLHTLASAPPLLRTAPAATLIGRLAELLPGDLDRIALAGSGSEAMEIALRTARLARPDRRRLVAASDSYHGKTLGALAVMGQEHLRVPFGRSWPSTSFVPHGDAAAAAEAIGDGVLAMVVEPILGGGTLSVPPDGYLAALREHCDATGTLLVVDEVQTGFGRTGTMFAVERDGIVPDMIVLSKAITGGHTPIAVTAVREGLLAGSDALAAAAAERPSESAGSPLVCAAANAALDFIVEHDLPGRAATLGPVVLDGLERIARSHPELVHDARGRGLMVGLRLRNRVVENALWLQLLKRGVLGALSLSVARTPVLRLYPPLTVERDEIERVLDVLDESLGELRRRLRPAVYDLGDQSLRFQHRLPPSLLRRGARLIG
ncbi:MAG TPA: aminotransferase class III-fold pyridoxal phosphate-dependent enzyme [Thermoleophilaceae bacterium]|jgi:putrescine aminotransferase